jgi:bacterial/archaeal transporter family protein
VIDWLLPTLVNIVAVAALGITSSRALRVMSWRGLLLPTAVAYLLVAMTLVAFGDAGLGLDGEWGWALLSGVLIVTAFVSMNVALGSGEASKVITFSAAYPAVTLLLAAVALGEAVTGGRWVGTFFVIAGASVIALSGPQLPAALRAPASWRWLGPTAVFTCALGVIGVTSRLALETLTWQDLVVWAALAHSTAATGVFLHGRARGERLVRADGWAAVAGVLAVLSLAALYLALGNGEASVVIPVSSAFPIVTLLLAWLLLGERLTVRRSVGTLVVVMGVVVITAV